MTARYTRPGLTSVAQPVRELGSVAATTLHRWVTTGEQQAPTILPTRIVLRGSCGCPETPLPATRSGTVPARESLKEEQK
jgi:LacI family transcriptional regulator